MPPTKKDNTNEEAGKLKDMLYKGLDEDALRRFKPWLEQRLKAPKLYSNKELSELQKLELLVALRSARGSLVGPASKTRLGADLRDALREMPSWKAEDSTKLSVWLNNHVSTSSEIRKWVLDAPSECPVQSQHSMFHTPSKSADDTPSKSGEGSETTCERCAYWKGCFETCQAMAKSQQQDLMSQIAMMQARSTEMHPDSDEEDFDEEDDEDDEEEDVQPPKKAARTEPKKIQSTKPVAKKAPTTQAGKTLGMVVKRK